MLVGRLVGNRFVYVTPFASLLVHHTAARIDWQILTPCNLFQSAIYLFSRRAKCSKLYCFSLNFFLSVAVVYCALSITMQAEQQEQKSINETVDACEL